MYTFNPLPDVPVDHMGFQIFLVCAAAWLFLVLMNPYVRESFFMWFFIMCIPVGIAYGVSYHWTNQETKVYANTQVIGKFVGYQPEGYSERTGKHRADKHYMYVVYEVSEGRVILRAQEGITYPVQAILYKN